MIELEKKFLRQIQDAKILSDNTLETVKKTFYSEIQTLKVFFIENFILNKIGRQKKTGENQRE